MTQIFISHSKNDEDLRSFFALAFASTQVKAVFEEFEKILSGEVTAAKIKQDIENSHAVFVILGQNVQNIPHTRDWIVWESGISKNKDIWVFEPFNQLGRISIIIPCLKHYVTFEINEGWLGYVQQIIESYDNPSAATTILAPSTVGVGIGATVAPKDKIGGAVLGGLLGFFSGIFFTASTDKSHKRPIGKSILCNTCRSSFAVHIPSNTNIFRCPVCNTFLELQKGA